jgi:hypothetical protein
LGSSCAYGRQMMKLINSRKIELIGHLMRNNDFITNIFEGKFAGKKTRRRPRKKYFEEIQESMNYKTFFELKNVALDREEWLQRQAVTLRD